MKITALSLTGTTPEARAEELGSRHAPQIRESVRLYCDFFEAIGLPEDRVREIALSCLGALRAWAPGLANEIELLAHHAGVELWQLAALNARTEVLSVAPVDGPGECSTAVFVPEGTETPLTIQTWDWLGVLCPEAFVVSYTPDQVLTENGGRVGHVRMFTECGMLGKIGVNSAGLGVHFNILNHESDRGVNGVPVHAIARRVLDEATTLAEAEAIIRSAHTSASTVLTVVQAAEGEHRAACFELSPERVSVVRPGADGWLLHTNNFIAEDQLAGAIAHDDSRTFDRLVHLESHRDQMMSPVLRERAQSMCGAAGNASPVCFVPDRAAPVYKQWTTLLTIGLDLEHAALEYFAGTPADLASEGAVRFG